ncbi:MAG TPA: ROK family protein [Candidatus Saccharimonadales bacterium]|nr:ROK family protein [Candidatus Saccharimonadales bacterium]
MYVGIDIGGTKLLAAASNDGRRMIRSHKIATPKDPRAALAAMIELVHQVSAGRPVASIGVSTPGPLDLHKGVILTPPNLPWHNVEIKRGLERSLHANVVVQHDAACGGLAEAILGAGKDYQRVLYVTISTGIGVSLITDGQVYHGAARNIEAGHITIAQDGPECSCGARGHFEALASGRAIKRQYGKFAYEIHDAKTWDQIAQHLAAGLSSLVAVYAPDVLVLAGGVSVHWRRFARPLAHYMAADFRYGIPPIKLAKYVETAPVIGALLLASQAERLLL